MTGVAWSSNGRMASIAVRLPRFGEIRAGWHDARRTGAPRLSAGHEYGDVFYATGYALGAVRELVQS